ncbi:MAG: hypothetical protein SVK54_05370 [candidate division WOR-3 bacterium]|nr:hypothetical protein [candidate division WOR-3 bacterium]
MKRFSFLFIFIIMFLSIYCVWDMIWSDGNEFHITATNYGVIGSDVINGGTGGYWPSGYPEENYIYGSGIWFGGLVDSITPGNDTIIDTLVSLGYNPSSGISELCPGDGSDAPEYDNELQRVYNSRDDWPPMRADSTVWFDSTFSDYDTYCFFSDKDPAQHFTTENIPMGITVKQWTYQWTIGLLNDVVFLRHVIKNENDDSLDIHDCYYAFSVDADIGNESSTTGFNDLAGFIDTMTVDYMDASDTLMQLNTVYQFQLEPETTWVHEPRILSLVMLETPITEEPIDLYHDGVFFIPPHEQLGMTSLWPRGLIISGPSVKEEYYQIMAGYDFYTYDPSDPETSYLPFPYYGNGVTGYPGQSEDSLDYGDKQFCMSSGPFDLDYGDSTIVTMAFVINQQPSDIVPNTLELMELWETGTMGIEDNRNTHNKIIMKNIVTDSRLSLSINGLNQYYNINLYDIKGRKVTHIFDGRISGERDIARKLNLPAGIYFINDAHGGFCEKLTLIK